MKLTFCLLLLTFLAAAQEPGRGGRGGQAQTPAATPAAGAPNAAAPPRDIPMKDDPPVVTHHEIKAGGKTLKYTVTTGLMPSKEENDEIQATLFYVAYTLDTDTPKEKRPLMFSFNGGPGSASIWLHMGAIGPKRVKMQSEGWLPPPPYVLEDNEFTWLDQTDLVFIDPVGTGFSRARNRDIGRRYWSLQGDLDSVSEFIRLYLTRNSRWTSPLFLVGESYGTTRAAGLSGLMIERGIAFNGIILLSSVLNFQSLTFQRGNDLPNIVYLPTYAAAAWYHKKLPAENQSKPLRKLLDEVEKWDIGPYQEALNKGDKLTDSERRAIVDQLAKFTGLDKKYIENSDLRIDNGHFSAELLRDQKHTIGRLDGRFKGLNALNVAERADFDPSMTAIRPPYTATFNQYVRSELNFKTDLTYWVLGGGIGQWDFGVGGQGGFADVSESLRSAFAKNPYMKLFVASGYYDFATPYFGTDYTMNHMRLDPSFQKNVTTEFYEAGHMMYIDLKSMAKLKKDIDAFIQKSLLN